MALTYSSGNAFQEIPRLAEITPKPSLSLCTAAIVKTKAGASTQLDLGFDQILAVGT